MNTPALDDGKSRVTFPVNAGAKAGQLLPVAASTQVNVPRYMATAALPCHRIGAVDGGKVLVGSSIQHS
jgi:hypothetical protein